MQKKKQNVSYPNGQKKDHTRPNNNANISSYPVELGIPGAIRSGVFDGADSTGLRAKVRASYARGNREDLDVSGDEETARENMYR